MQGAAMSALQKVWGFLMLTLQSRLWAASRARSASCKHSPAQVPSSTAMKIWKGYHTLGRTAVRGQEQLFFVQASLTSAPFSNTQA